MKRQKSKNGAPIAWLNAHVGHDGDECLIWPFARAGSGYGNLRVGKKYTNAHRAMTQLVHGEPPFPEAEAAHSCGKGREGCVHPKHLRWDTISGNHADKVRHGTMIRGEAQWQAKLTESQVLSIFSDARPDGVIAAEYGVSRELVTRIQAGKCWAWLTSQKRAA